MHQHGQPLNENPFILYDHGFAQTKILRSYCDIFKNRSHVKNDYKNDVYKLIAHFHMV